jgi:hypothetical protein
MFMLFALQTRERCARVSQQVYVSMQLRSPKGLSSLYYNHASLWAAPPKARMPVNILLRPQGLMWTAAQGRGRFKTSANARNKSTGSRPPHAAVLHRNYWVWKAVECCWLYECGSKEGICLGPCVSRGMKAYGGSGFVHFFSLTSALVGGEWTALRPCCLTSGEIAPGTHGTRRKETEIFMAGKICGYLPWRWKWLGS